MASQSSVCMRLATCFRNAHQTLETNLMPLWKEMFGDKEDIIKERVDTIEENITTLINDMVREENENKTDFITKYEELLQEAQTLERELSIQVQRRDMGKEPLYGRIKSLEQDLETHRVVRRERMAILETLQREEKDVCAKLQEPCIYADYEDVPSEAKLSEIRAHVRAQEVTLKAQHAKYCKLRKQIVNLWSELELKPEGSFEHQIEHNELENLLGTENLATLEATALKLEDAKTKMNSELETLQYKLTTLWNRLNTEAKERERFLTTNTRCCVSTIQAFKQEIEVCTALKLTRIKDIVGSIRSELEDWWSRVHFGQEQRDQFVEFTIEHDITEEVLESHEREVEKVKQYFDENREVIELLEQRFELWEEMVKLEDKANDKDRLFSNRGGQLLTEEKKRKFLQKELPKLERRLDKLFDAYENTHGAHFLYDGHNARELILAQWDERNKAKENVKQAKKNVVSGVTASRSRVLGPSAQNVTGRQTPNRNATLKRKAEQTPVLDSKRRLLNSATKPEPVKTTNTLPPTSKLLSVSKRPKHGGSNPTSSVPSYSVFQNQLNDNAALNSTYVAKSVQSSTGKGKVIRSTPVPAKSKLPARSKLMSPKVRSKLPTSTARTPITPGTTFSRSRSQLALTPRSNVLTRSRSHAHITPGTTPKHRELPFIF